MEVLTRRMQSTDLESVCAIHMQQFPNNRSSSLGRPFVRKMYRWFLSRQPELSVVAELDGEVAGFVVGAIGGYGRKIFRYAFPEIVFGVALHPGIIFRKRTFMLWRSYLQGLLPAAGAQAASPANGPVYAGLSSIAVNPKHARMGVGAALVRAFEAAAQAQGAGKVGLSVEKENIPAQKTYERCGWVRQPTSDEAPSRVYYKTFESREDPV